MRYALPQEWAADLPWPFTIGLLLFLCTPVGLIHLIAWRVNGLPFCVALSGNQGDLLLSFVVMCALYALQSHLPLPGWSTSVAYHWIILGVAVGAAVALLVVANPWAHRGPNGRIFWDDVYHSAVIVPVFLYLLFAIALPVLLASGTPPLIRGAMAAAIAAYCLLVASDFEQKRMDQRAWVKKETGITFPLPRR